MIRAYFSMNRNQHQKRKSEIKGDTENIKKKQRADVINVQEMFTQLSDLHGQLHCYYEQVKTAVDPHWNLRLPQHDDNLMIRRCKIVQRMGGGPAPQPPTEILLEECMEKPTTTGTQTGSVVGPDPEETSRVNGEEVEVTVRDLLSPSYDLVQGLREFEAGSSPAAELEDA